MIRGIVLGFMIGLWAATFPIETRDYIASCKEKIVIKMRESGGFWEALAKDESKL